MGCSFFYGRPAFAAFGACECGDRFYPGDARQRGFKTPRHCIGLSNFDRHVVWVMLCAPLGFKTASKVEITRKTLSY